MKNLIQINLTYARIALLLLALNFLLTGYAIYSVAKIQGEQDCSCPKPAGVPKRG